MGGQPGGGGGGGGGGNWGGGNWGGPNQGWGGGGQGGRQQWGGGPMGYRGGGGQSQYGPQQQYENNQLQGPLQGMLYGQPGGQQGNAFGSFANNQQQQPGGAPPDPYGFGDLGPNPVFTMGFSPEEQARNRAYSEWRRFGGQAGPAQDPGGGLSPTGRGAMFQDLHPPGEPPHFSGGSGGGEPGAWGPVANSIASLSPFDQYQANQLGGASGGGAVINKPGGGAIAPQPAGGGAITNKPGGGPGLNSWLSNWGGWGGANDPWSQGGGGGGETSLTGPRPPAPPEKPSRPDTIGPTPGPGYFPPPKTTGPSATLPGQSNQPPPTNTGSTDTFGGG